MHRRFFAAAVSAATLLVFGSAVASANFQSGNWPWSGGNTLALNYVNNATAYGLYSTAIQGAVSAWNSTNTPVSLNASSQGTIIANTVNDSSVGYWGVARTYALFTQCAFGICVPAVLEVPYRNCANPCSMGAGWGNYVLSYATLNRATMGGLSSDMKQKVAAHELGHSLGLHHTSCIAVMQQGTVSWNGPTVHDEHEIKRLYPSALANPNVVCNMVLIPFP
jgi:hypothetical protein